MLESPEIRYARSGSHSIAYQVIGDGPVELVEVPGLLNHIEIVWEEPGLVRYFEDLSRFARVVLYDQRGTGLSDRWAPGEVPTLEERLADLHAVLDAAGLQRPVLLGVADGGPVAIRFALAHPERTRALLLYNSFACCLRRPGYEYGIPPPEAERFRAELEREWGRGTFIAAMFGDGSEEARRVFARRERRLCTPATAAALARLSLEADVRDALPGLTVPTLVLHDSVASLFPVEGARYVAANVHGARLIELPPVDRPMRERPHLADAIEEFVTGGVTASDTRRVLAAVLFTDIVGSTERAAVLGDQRWSDLLEEHDRRVRRAVEAHLGRVVKTMGDGVLARFDGAARAVRCALGVVEEARRLGLAVRAGVHVGDCELRREDLAGMTVHVGSRVAARAAAGEVLVTATVRDALVGAGFAFEDRGRHALKGVPGEWTLLAARDAAAPRATARTPPGD